MEGEEVCFFVVFIDLVSWVDFKVLKNVFERTRGQKALKNKNVRLFDFN